MEKESKINENNSENIQEKCQNLEEEIRELKAKIKWYEEQSDLANRTANLLLAGFTSTGTDFEEILRIQYKVLEYGLKHIEAVADYNTAVAKAEKLMNTVNY